MKVKDFPNWRKIMFNGRTVLKADTKYMSWQQIQVLDELEVLEEMDGGKTLVVENRQLTTDQKYGIMQGVGEEIPLRLFAFFWVSAVWKILPGFWVLVNFSI